MSWKNLPCTLARAVFPVALLAIAACARLHTLESTSDLSRDELAALCADLQMRASQECRWDRQDQSVSVADRQTWEINCMARRDSARDSYDNICQPPRYERPEPDKD